MDDAVMAQIAMSELPEPLQQIISNVQRTGAPLTVTQNGDPIVIVYPAAEKPACRAAFGVLKGSGQILEDLVEPGLPLLDWEVLQ
jgi:prevent-host-death family protein